MRRIDPLSPHGMRIAVVKRLVKGASFDNRAAMARELQILKSLQKEFHHEQFWADLQPAEKLDTLAWFKTEYGHAALVKEWDLFRFGRVQEFGQFEVDSRPTPRMVEDTKDLPKLSRKKTLAEWADS
mgnify:CR=1 FL=1